MGYKGYSKGSPIIQIQGGFNRMVERFVATEGQKVFTLTKGSYEVGQNKTNVIVGGSPQTCPENYEETSPNSITLSEEVSAGTVVIIEYYQ